MEEKYKYCFTVYLIKRLRETIAQLLLGIANPFGYEPEASVGRAFKKMQNITSGNYNVRKLSRFYTIVLWADLVMGLATGHF